MLIRECMSRDTTGVTTETPVRQAFELMANRDVESLPVLDSAHRLVGCVTAHDLWDLLCREDNARLAGPIGGLADADAPCVDVDDPLESAAPILFSHPWLSALPVLERGAVVGWISRQSLLHALAHHDLPNAEALPAIEADEPPPDDSRARALHDWQSGVPDSCVFLG